MKLEFRRDLPVEQTMAFEALFHDNLAFDREEKADLLADSSVKLWLLVDGILAGETYGMAVPDIGEELEGCQAYQRDDVFYVYSIAILPEFQGKGLAKILKAYSLGMIFGEGFKAVIDHAHEGASLHLNQLFGARVISEHRNWYETGETYYLNEISGP